MTFVKALFGGLLIILALFSAIFFVQSGSIETPIKTLNGERGQTASDMPGVSCEWMEIPVKLPSSIITRQITGQLCQPKDQPVTAIQVLIAGAGYGMAYWDFPYQSDTYSYARAALKQGFATFNFYRLGTGESSHPFGVVLGVDNQANALQQVISYLNTKQRFEKLITVGHSFGSLVAIAHAINFSDQVDGIVLTGYAHGKNPGFYLAMRTGVDVAMVADGFAGHLFDPSYIVSKTDSRKNTFYDLTNTDPNVIAVDELNRQTLTVGEIISMPPYFTEVTHKITDPVYLLLGEYDFVVCGGDLDCTDHAGTIAHEQSFFSEQACLEMDVLDDTNHNANLHRNAAASFQKMLEWSKRLINADQACSADRSEGNYQGMIEPS